MKNNTNLKAGIIVAGIVSGALFWITSCSGSKAEDVKEIAEEHNEDKTKNTGEEKDAQFLVSAAGINLEEIRLGQLAQQSGMRSEVKELGKMMEASHSKSEEELASLATNKSIALPASPTDKALDTYNTLSHKSGKSFDGSYCSIIISGHKQAIVVFEKAVSESQDADVKAWAQAQLSELRMHLDHALTCQKKCEKM
jgi:putative membrane protein